MKTLTLTFWQLLFFFFFSFHLVSFKIVFIVYGLVIPLVCLHNQSPLKSDSSACLVAAPSTALNSQFEPSRAPILVILHQNDTGFCRQQCKICLPACTRHLWGHADAFTACRAEGSAGGVVSSLTMVPEASYSSCPSCHWVHTHAYAHESCAPRSVSLMLAAPGLEALCWDRTVEGMRILWSFHVLTWKIWAQHHCSREITEELSARFNSFLLQLSEDV